jgi:hypothetical protein
MYRKMLIGTAAVTALALSGTGFAMAAGGGGGSQSGEDPSAKVTAAKTGPGVYTCNGGAQKQTLTKINVNPSTFGEGPDFDVPIGFAVKGPKHGKDTLNITFSAESQLRGSSANDYFDWMELEVHVDGVPIQPVGPAGSPLAFTGSKEYGSHAAQFCTKIGKGKHRITVVSRLVDNGSADSLTGWLDDMTLNAVKSN